MKYSYLSRYNFDPRLFYGLLVVIYIEQFFTFILKNSKRHKSLWSNKIRNIYFARKKTHRKVGESIFSTSAVYKLEIQCFFDLHLKFRFNIVIKSWRSLKNCRKTKVSFYFTTLTITMRTNSWMKCYTNLLQK